MQNENSISKITMPLRFLYDWLTDEEFKVVMSGLSKKELDILKLVFKPEYLNLNSVKLTDYEVTILKRTLTETTKDILCMVLELRELISSVLQKSKLHYKWT